MAARALIFFLLNANNSVARRHGGHGHHNNQGYHVIVPVQGATIFPTASIRGTTTTTSSVTLTKTISVEMSTSTRILTIPTFAIRDATQERELIVGYRKSTNVVGGLEGIASFSEFPDHTATLGSATDSRIPQLPKTFSLNRFVADPVDADAIPCTDQDIATGLTEISWYAFPDAASATTRTSQTAVPSPTPSPQIVLKSADSDYALVVLDHRPYYVPSNSTAGLDHIFAVDDKGVWTNVQTGYIAAADRDVETDYIQFWSREDRLRLSLSPSTCSVQQDEDGRVGFHCNNLSFCSTDYGLRYCYNFPDNPNPNAVQLFSGLER
ncbi:hypothetical protein E8E14_007142 [Neopestalotiopsis sp. 37M]|nr:hypothetical protein E8E14_007142 [Neopestalotiopsis sp. 37M]